VGERDLINNIGGSELIRHNNTSASFEGRIGRGINPRQTGGPFNTGQDQRLAYSSNHTGGCNFVFGDGAVRFISNGIDCDVNENWTVFPHASGYTFPNTGQRLEHPTDGFPVTLQ